jgi:MoaA/NifB/PqqE/SkfB family radical SAM enzyme
MNRLGPKIVEFQTTTLCTAKCTVCPWPEVKGASKPVNMTDAIWQKLLKDLNEVKPSRIIPYLNNEPLVDKRLEERIKTLREMNPDCEIEISTNGKLLTRDKAEALLRLGITDLFISVFGYDKDSHARVMGLDYDLICKNLLSLKDVREKIHSSTKVSIIQVIAPDISQDLMAKAKNFFESLDFEVLNYGYLDRAGNVKESLLGKSQRDVKLIPKGCELNRHYERMYVLTDGTVTFCCHDWRVVEPVGNIMETSLKEIWESVHYQDIRDKIDGKKSSEESFLCRKCKLCYS